MLALTRKGMSRQEAHELMRTLTIKSESEGQPFKETLLKNDTVRKMLSEKEINEALDPRNYLGTAIEQVDSVLQKTRQERKTRSQGF